MQLALGKVLLHRGDLAGAAIHMLAAIKPNRLPGHFYLGQILSVQGESDQAVLQLREAARLAPKDADPHRALARAMSAQGKTPEALAEANTAVELAPKSAEAHDELGSLLAQGDQ